MKNMVKLPALLLLITCLTLGGISRTASAGNTLVVNQKQAVTTPPIEGCNGEHVILTGEEHILVRGTIDSSGGYHLKFHYDSNASGLGDTTGAKYVYNANIETTINLNGSWATNTTDDASFELIGQGDVPDQRGFAKLHLTVTPQGQVTALVDNAKVTCSN